MNKKGIVWETISDVFLAGLIIFIGLTMFFLLNGLHQNRVNTYMDQKVSNLDNDEIFVSYLNAEIQTELTLSEQIVLAHLNSDDTQLEEELDSFLEKIYSTKVCWRLYEDESKWLEKNKCKKEEDLLDSTVIIPLPDKTVLKTRLHIMGYAK